MKRSDNNFLGNLFLVVFVSALLFVSFNQKSISQVVLLDFDEPNTISVNGPQFIPFDDTSQLLDTFGDAGCNMLRGTITNLLGPVSIGPALDFAETGPLQPIGSDPTVDIEIVQLDLVSTDPITGEPLDPTMNQLGISVVPGGADSFFDVFFEIDCGTSSTTSSSTSSSGSTSTTSSSGSVVSSTSSGSTGFSDLDILSSAVIRESFARNTHLDLQEVAEGGIANFFSLDSAIQDINFSLTDLNTLSSRLSGSMIRFAMGMVTIQAKIQEIIDKDQEALMIIQELKDSGISPDIANSEFTVPVTQARRALKAALRCKKQVQKKLQREERRSSMSGSGMSSMSGMSGSGMSSMSGMSGTPAMFR